MVLSFLRNPHIDSHSELAGTPTPHHKHLLLHVFLMIAILIEISGVLFLFLPSNSIVFFMFYVVLACISLMANDSSFKRWKEGQMFSVEKGNQMGQTAALEQKKCQLPELARNVSYQWLRQLPAGIHGVEKGSTHQEVVLWSLRVCGDMYVSPHKNAR